MKITRIKEIKNVGTFGNFANGGSLGLEKLTFIYGLNTFGKTTLSDIFQSLKYNAPEIITSRRTIPHQSTPQKVILSVKEGADEKDQTFQNDNWNANNTSEFLEVFGTEFIHKNLFTGLSIERANKENLTQFILGEEGVFIAQKITEEKKDLGNKKRALPGELPQYVKEKNEAEIENFLKFEIKELNKDKIDSDLLSLKKQKQDEENRLKEPQKILNLENVSQIEIHEWKILDYFQALNEFLGKDYSNIKTETLEKLNEHINKNFSEIENAERWIKYGFNNTKDKEGDCLFCGQSLVNTRELMNVYDSYFDEAYSHFISEIESNLSINIKLAQDSYFGLKEKIQNSFSASVKYKDLILNEKFQKLLTDLEEEIKKISEDNLVRKKQELIEIFNKSIYEKNRKPYVKIDQINFSSFKTDFETYKNILVKVKTLLKEIQDEIDIFKEKYKDTQNISKRIEEISSEIENLEYKKARVAQNEDCEKYLQKKSEIRKIEEGIAKKQEELKKNQAEYLENYFNKIDELFKKFGSKNFSLEKEESNLGTPTK